MSCPQPLYESEEFIRPGDSDLEDSEVEMEFDDLEMFMPNFMDSNADLMDEKLLLLKNEMELDFLTKSLKLIRR